MKSMDVNWLRWTPFKVSSGDMNLFDLFLTPRDGTEDFSRDVALGAPDGLKLEFRAAMRLAIWDWVR